MDSFDVFDTVIGRVCYKGINIFKVLESIFNIPNFQAIRMAHEKDTLDKTYTSLSSIISSTYDLNAIKKKEIELEYEFSFPIYKYLNKVMPSDIFVSDMYLPNSVIRNMIMKHKDISTNFLHVSCGDKSSGNFWRSNPLARRIRTHYGDNYHSDYQNARAHGVNAVWIDNIGLTPMETLLESIMPEISYVVRAVRLTLQNDNMFTTYATNIMLPITIIVAHYIHAFCKRESIEEIVFLSRDGYWFKVVYDILYPSDSTRYEYFSRLYVSNPENARKLIDSLNNGKRNIVIDLMGSGKTFSNVLGPHLHNTQYLLIFRYTNVHATPTTVNNIVFIPTEMDDLDIKFYIEDLFSAAHGSVGVTGELLAPEYDILILKPYMEAMALFKQYVGVYRKYDIPITPAISLHVLHDKLLESMKFINRNSDLSALRSSIKHVNKHTDIYTKYPLTYYSQIGQDEYYITNISKFKPNGIFLDIGGYDGITGSNTYFLEKYLNWSGIIVECNPSILDTCRANRTSPIVPKAIYSVSGTTVDICVPTGAQLTGGCEQLSGIVESLRPETLEIFRAQFSVSHTIKVPTITINDIVHQYNLSVIDYMSLDIEGYEVEALKTIDFTAVKILYLTVEHAGLSHVMEEIYRILTRNGYERVRTNRWDDEYRLV